MSRQALFEITPVDDGWVVRMPTDSMFELRPSKREAIRLAQQLGKHFDAWRIRVLSKTGDRW